MDSSKLIVFVKAPRSGFVKTRLAATLGAEAACAAYGRLVEILLRRISGLHRVELRFTPDDAEAEIGAWLRPGWDARPQGEGHLGARLHSAFAEAYAQGARRIVLIGSDCPEVSEADVVKAWAALARNDLILGPSADGGYWLIGLREPRPSLFDGIAWSTESVMDDTIGRASALGLRIELLRRLADVDTEADWKAFLTQGQAR